MRMKWNKDDIYGAIGTIVFHGIILAILGFTIMRAQVPEEDGGVLVNFGNIDAAAGTFEPQYTGPEAPQETASTSLPEPAPEPTPPDQGLLTQDLEESVSLNEEEEKREQEAEAEKLRKEQKERERAAEERRKRQEAISNQVADAFGAGQAAGNSQGDAPSGTGNQGSPFGNSDHGENEGIGGYGSFDLNGRSLGAGGLPRPAYTIQEEGRIVINITVNPKGNVIFAEIGRGTNIDNASMRRSALEAARKAQFNSISGANNQSGTITYVYRLK